MKLTMRHSLILFSALALLVLAGFAHATVYVGFGTYDLRVGDVVNVTSSAGTYIDAALYNEYTYALQAVNGTEVEFAVNNSRPVRPEVCPWGDPRCTYVPGTKTRANENLDAYTGIQVALLSLTNGVARVAFNPYAPTPTPEPTPVRLCGSGELVANQSMKPSDVVTIGAVRITVQTIATGDFGKNTRFTLEYLDGSAANDTFSLLEGQCKKLDGVDVRVDRVETDPETRAVVRIYQVGAAPAATPTPTPTLEPTPLATPTPTPTPAPTTEPTSEPSSNVLVVLVNQLVNITLETKGPTPAPESSNAVLVLVAAVVAILAVAYVFLRPQPPAAVKK